MLQPVCQIQINPMVPLHCLLHQRYHHCQRRFLQLSISIRPFLRFPRRVKKGPWPEPRPLPRNPKRLHVPQLSTHRLQENLSLLCAQMRRVHLVPRITIIHKLPHLRKMAPVINHLTVPDFQHHQPLVQQKVQLSPLPLIQFLFLKLCVGSSVSIVEWVKQQKLFYININSGNTSRPKKSIKLQEANISFVPNAKKKKQGKLVIWISRQHFSP